MTAMRQVLVLITLLVLMQVVIQVGTASNTAFDSLTLLTTGFILVGAYSMGELFRSLRLPALLGYLGAGVLFGPRLVALVLGDPSLAPIGSKAIAELGLVNVLAVGVIGTMGGGEIKLAQLRENIGTIAAICASVFVLVLPIVAAVVLGLSFVAPSVVPFLAELPLPGRIAGALLFGTLAVGMSPAATLALMQEVRARGKFTSLVLGVVVLGDLILVATFLLVLALAKLLISPEGLSWASLVEQLPHIAAEFGWALVLGIGVGVLFIAYLRFVAREVLLFSVALVFVTAFVAARLHAETLLAFLLAGFVVQNFSRHGHTLVEAFERIALPVFVVYFTAQAAALDLVAVTVYLPLTLILVVLRVGLFAAGIGWGARKVGVEDATRKRLQLAFFSQGGVDLVLAAMIAEAIPGWGVEVQTVTMATVLLYVVGGPPLLARALDAVGESAAARERGAEQLQAGPVVASQPEASGPSAAEPELVWEPPTATGDSSLDSRLTQLHGVVTGLYTDLVEAGVLARARARAQVLTELSGRIGAALDAASGPDEARLARARLDLELAAQTRAITPAALAPLDGSSLAELFAALEQAQPFEQSFRVVRSAALFEGGRGRGVAVLRAARRVRRAIAGPGQRSVAIGRLWRYHVVLAVPVALWRSTRSADAELWYAVFEHYQRTRAQLDALVAGTWSSVIVDVDLDRDAHAHADAHADGHADAHADAHTSAEDTPILELEPWLAQVRARARAREQALVDRLAAVQAELTGGFSRGLTKAWAEFLDSVALAGTLERPAWRSRPSSRHDAAQAATAELLERSARDREAGAGRLDALATLTHAERLATATRVAATTFEDRVSASVTQLDREFGQLLDAELGAHATSDSESFDEALVRMRAHVDLLRVDLARLTRTDSEPLAGPLEETPEQLAPAFELAAPGVDPDPRRAAIRLRAWLAQTLVSEWSAARAQTATELRAGLEQLRESLTHVGRVVDYHRSSDPDRRDPGLDERLATLLGRARAQLQTLDRGARDRIEASLDSAERTGLDPIRAGQWDELSRRLRRLDEGRRATVGDWVRERGQATLDHARARAGVFADELEAVFEDRHTPGAVAAWHRALWGPPSTMPEPYQRLFVSVPAESVGLLVPRPELELVVAGAERWLAGQAGAMLIHGDPGVGKRTLVRQLGSRLGERIELAWLRLSPTLDAEADVVAQLGPWLVGDAGPARRFAQLREQLQTRAPESMTGDPRGRGPRPRAIVVENSERLFRRTPTGLARFREFLELLAASDAQVLWIVLMAAPAVTVLDPAVELRARFGTRVEVPAMTATQLGAVLGGRHRLSGYDLRLQPGHPSLSQWLREPAFASLWRSPERVASERLARLSGGNIRQAMRLWLAAAHADPSDPRTVVVGPFPDQACPLLAEVPLSSRVLLAALLVHGSLARADLAELHARHRLDLDTELARLAELGLVGFDDGGFVRIETRLVQPLTTELRACNLL